MNLGNLIKIASKIPVTHTFSYKNKQFPFNMRFLDAHTSYFQEHRNEIQQDNTILIKDDPSIQLSDDSINDFINFCHYQKIDVNNINVNSLHYLSKKYKVQSLYEETTNYILSNRKDLVLDYLLLEPNDEEATADFIQYEELISQDLAHFIDDDKMVQLPIPVLHRIISKSPNIDQGLLEKFLLKCLTQIGQKASVLFSAIDVKKISSECANKLLNEYEDIFDFHFINKAYLKNIYDQQTEFFKIAEKAKIEYETKMSKMEEENKDLKKEIEELKSKIKKIQSYQMFLFDGNEKHGLLGIIHYLSYISGGGNIHDKGIVEVTSSSIYDDIKDWEPKSVVNFDNFDRYFASKDEKIAYLTIDFKNRKIRPTHYTIRSRSSCDNYHPCNWIFEGSNDNENWKELDNHLNDKSLNGLNITKTFCIKTQLLPNECFEYIRIKLSGSDSSGQSQFLIFSAIEFFGILYTLDD